MPPFSSQPVILRPAEVAALPTMGFSDTERGNTTWQTLFSAPATPTTSLCGGVAECPADGYLALHRHTQAEIYFILAGSGEIEINGKRTAVSPNSVVWIPGDAEHGVFCTGERLKWLYVFPEGSFENVVYRFSKNDERSTTHGTPKL